MIHKELVGVRIVREGDMPDADHKNSEDYRQIMWYDFIIALRTLCVSGIVAAVVISAVMVEAGNPHF